MPVSQTDQGKSFAVCNKKLTKSQFSLTRAVHPAVLFYRFHMPHSDLLVLYPAVVSTVLIVLLLFFILANTCDHTACQPAACMHFSPCLCHTCPASLHNINPCLPVLFLICITCTFFLTPSYLHL